MNLTLAVDEEVAERARRAAQAMGKSLNQVVREYLEQLAGDATIEAEIAELGGGVRHARFGEVPGIGVNGAVAHCGFTFPNQPSFR